MVIRLADKKADFPAILRGARNFIARMDFSDHLPSDERSLAEAISRILALDDVDVIVVETDKRIVGGLGMIYAPYLWNPEIVSGEELFFWTAPDAPPTAALALLRFMRRRATEKGAAILNFAALTSSPATIGRAYERLGMQMTQMTYTGLI